MHHRLAGTQRCGAVAARMGLTAIAGDDNGERLAVILTPTSLAGLNRGLAFVAGLAD